MAEKLQKDSDMSPELHLQQVNGEIAAALDHSDVPAAFGGGKGGGGPGGGQNMSADATIGAVAQATLGVAGLAASLFISAADAAGGSNKGPGQKKDNDVSRYIPGQQRRLTVTPTPLVPWDYSQKVAMAKRAAKAGPKAGAKNTGGTAFGDALVASMSEASMSVTGSGVDGNKKTPIKGIKVSPQVAATLGLIPSGLAEDLNNTLRTRDVSRFESTKRLQDEISKGSQPAKKLAQTNPNVRPPSRPGRGSHMTST